MHIFIVNLWFNASPNNVKTIFEQFVAVDSVNIK